MKKIIVLCLIVFFPFVAFAFDLSELKQTCSELGFQAGTKDHGQCVITLVKKEKQSASSQKPSPQPSNNLTVQLQQQQLRQMQQQQMAIQSQLLEEAKKQRQLRALGLAQQGLDLAFPNNSQGSNNSGPSSVWCGSYGMNTVCNAN